MPTLPARACTGLVSGDGEPGRLVAPLNGASGSANSRSLKLNLKKKNR